jgi:transcriptional regulator NrdR family protein
MLCPHFPLENNLSQEELEKIISNLLTATEKRKLEIQKYMGSIDSRLKERGEAEIQG